MVWNVKSFHVGNSTDLSGQAFWHGGIDTAGT